VASLTVFLQRLTRGLAANALSGLPDRELLQRFASRHEETAFEALVRRHGPMVLRVCWRVLRQSQDAEDAFQATFLLLARNARSVRKPDSLASWLHGVARRVAFKARTQRAVRRRHEELYAATAGLPAQTEAEELRSALDEALMELPEPWRLPLILCYLEGLTQDEAAAQLGWSTRTFRRRLDEARDELGRLLTQRGVALSAALSVLLLSDYTVPAALPASLAASTVEAGSRLVAGKSAAGIVSAEVLALTEGMRTAMFTNSLKTIVALGLLAAAVATGAWVLEGRAAQHRSATPGDKSSPSPKEAAAGASAAKARAELKADKIITTTGEQVHSATITPDGKFVITVTSEADKPILETRIKVWDSRSGECKATHLETTTMHRVALSRSGKQLLVGSDMNDKETALYDVSDLTKEPRRIRTLATSPNPATSVAISADAKSLLVGMRDESVQLCSAETGEVTWSKEAHEQGKLGKWVSTVAFSPDGKLVVSAGDDTTVQVRDAADGSLKTTLKGHEGAVTAARFSPDGKLIASGGYDGTVRIWNAVDGKLLHKIDVAAPEHCSVRSLAFSPDGKLLAIGGLQDVGQTVLGLWDVQRGKRIRVLTGHKGGAFSVAFTKDGTTLMAGGWTGGVGLWRLKPAPKK
jgi:RNA polymerase sigma factor (sigma-70 family)